LSQLLFDTNALVFYTTLDKRIGKKTIALLNRSELFYSPLSLIELNQKNTNATRPSPELQIHELDSLGIEELQVDSGVAGHLIDLETSDPFDIALVAQAKHRGMLFLTSDLRILGSDLKFVRDLTD
jgi:PIN domain nuclease of toxin-antitoxin system